MARFPTQFDGSVPVVSNPGSRKHKLYHAKYDKAGVLELVCDGEEDIYELIQSHADSCDIHSIIARYSNGDASALSAKQGVFADFSDAPRTLADVLNCVNDAQRIFDSLPVDERAKFDHSLAKWLAALDAAAQQPVAGSASSAESAVEKKESESSES